MLKDELTGRKLLNLVAGGICYCRTYHGGNTWDKNHHLNRVKNFKIPLTKKQLKEAEKIYGQYMVDMSAIY